MVSTYLGRLQPAKPLASANAAVLTDTGDTISMASGYSLTRGGNNRTVFSPDLQNATTGVHRRTYTNTVSTNFIDNPNFAQPGLSQHNIIRNSVMYGTVPGTPGTLPTTWGTYFPITGVTRTINGMGIENGIPYIEIRYNGIASATTTFLIQADVNNIIVSPGDVLTSSFYIAVVAGSTANISNIYITNTETSNAFAFLRESTTTSLLPYLNTSLTRFAKTATMGANSYYYYPNVAITPANTSGTIDITLRIGGLQVERLPYVNKWQPTPAMSENLLRNNNVDSSGGTAFPYYWGADPGGGGLTRTNIGSGKLADGRGYMDVRLFGNTNGTGTYYTISFDNFTPIVQGETYYGECDVVLLAGSMANITNNAVKFAFNENNSGSTFINATSGQEIVPTATAQTVHLYKTVSSASAAFGYSYLVFNYAAAVVAIDVTLRIIQPRLRKVAVTPGDRSILPLNVSLIRDLNYTGNTSFTFLSVQDNGTESNGLPYTNIRLNHSGAMTATDAGFLRLSGPMPVSEGHSWVAGGFFSRGTVTGNAGTSTLLATNVNPRLAILGRDANGAVVASSTSSTLPTLQNSDDTWNETQMTVPVGTKTIEVGILLNSNTAGGTITWGARVVGLTLENTAGPIYTIGSTDKATYTARYAKPINNTYIYGPHRRYSNPRWIVENQTTNTITNPRFLGAYVGMTGAPSGMSWSSGGGLTRQIVGQGTSGGMDYVDVRIYGTATSTSSTSLIMQNPVVAATAASRWFYSQYLAVVGGSTTNISSFQIVVNQYNSGAFVTNSPTFLSAVPGVVGPDLLAQRYVNEVASVDATANQLQPVIYLGYSIGAAVDITLRIGHAQLENTLGSTSITRPTDYTIGTTIGYNETIDFPISGMVDARQARGALIWRGHLPTTYTGVTAIAFISDLTTNNEVGLVYGSGGAVQVYVNNANASGTAIARGTEFIAGVMWDEYSEQGFGAVARLYVNGVYSTQVGYTYPGGYAYYTNLRIGIRAATSLRGPLLTRSIYWLDRAVTHQEMLTRTTM